MSWYKAFKKSLRKKGVWLTREEFTIIVDILERGYVTNVRELEMVSVMKARRLEMRSK